MQQIRFSDFDRFSSNKQQLHKDCSFCEGFYDRDIIDCYIRLIIQTFVTCRMLYTLNYIHFLDLYNILYT